jgi:aryl-alcohol dehydrogenase-like predicted oxidoreductase
MRVRQLGRTGLTVSEVGFGTWGLGGDSYGPVDDATSRDALHLAFDRGVTFYDTSDLYGAGHSEQVLGDAFRDRRDRVVIATKVGTLPHSGFYMPQDFATATIEAGLEASLRRLGTDYVDLYQLHSPQLDLPNWDAIIETLQRLQAAGKIRAYGLSARSPGDARAAVERFGFPVVQVNYNLIDHRAAENGLFALCAERGVGVIARTPLCFGYLSGTMTGDEEFVGRDHRANWPREQLRRWARAPQLFAPLNAGSSRTLVQLALQFCLADPAVSTVIPGMLTRAEVIEDTTVADLPPLAADEHARIRDIYKADIFYDPQAKSLSPTASPGVQPA